MRKVVISMHTKTRVRLAPKIKVLLVLAAILALIIILRSCATEPDEAVSTSPPVQTEEVEKDPFTQLSEYAAENNFSMSEWPDALIELLEKNPETLDFVMYYPVKKDLTPTINLDGILDNNSSDYANCMPVPLLFQWDERWGYTEYSGELLGLSGCGPTCLSMVCIYLLHDAKYSPRYIADFSQENGYYYTGSGSTWTLISEGGEKLGLDVQELPLSEGTIISKLNEGKPVICVMGPGVFTTTGHFIVLTGYEDGKFKVNDPNSPSRSEKLWEFSEFGDQIRNLWACSKAADVNPEV